MIRPRHAFSALTALLVSAPALASAQSNIALDTDWRRRERPERSEKLRSTQNAAFEARFGSYAPEIDSEPGLRGKPFESVFGSGGAFYFGLEVDWQALRIPYVGAVGPGVGWGYNHHSTTAKIAATGADSGEKTTFTVYPMYASAVLRLDEAMQRTGMPLVPYGKFGFGFAPWNTGTSSGTSVSHEPKGDVIGSGVSYGLMWSLGGMLCLNGLDRRSAAALDETVGINHVYLFGEWFRMSLDGFGREPSVMRVGSSTVAAGLAFDM